MLSWKGWIIFLITSTSASSYTISILNFSFRHVVKFKGSFISLPVLCSWQQWIFWSALGRLVFMSPQPPPILSNFCVKRKRLICYPLCSKFRVKGGEVPSFTSITFKVAILLPSIVSYVGEDFPPLPSPPPPKFAPHLSSPRNPKHNTSRCCNKLLERGENKFSPSILISFPYAHLKICSRNTELCIVLQLYMSYKQHWMVSNYA